MTALAPHTRLYYGATRAPGLAKADDVWPVRTFTPSSLPGLAIWLDAAQLSQPDHTEVTHWPNLGSGPDPTIVGSPAPRMHNGALGGHAAVYFMYNEGRLRWNGTSGLYKDYTVIYVGHCWELNHPGRIVAAAYPLGGNVLFGYWTTYEDIAYVTGGGGFFNPNPNKPVTIDWKMYSGDCATPEVAPRLFSDGALLSSHPTPPAADGFGNTFNISGYDADAVHETCCCEIAEVIAYNRKLPDSERQQVEGYLREKWLTWTPAKMAGCLAWYDAAALTSGPVTAWPDASGHGHGAATIGTAPTAGANGVTFTGDMPSSTRMKIARLGTTLSGRTDWSVIMRLRPAGAFGHYPIVLTAPADGAWSWILEFDASAGFYVGQGSGAYRMFAANIAPNQWQTLTATMNAGTARLFKDGTEITAYSLGGSDCGPTVPALGPDVLLGGYFNDAYGFNGDIGEMAVYDHALNSTERGLLDTYLSEKWGP